jgi:aminopeptidase C
VMQAILDGLGDNAATGGMRYNEEASWGKSAGGSGIPVPKLE